MKKLVFIFCVFCNAHPIKECVDLVEGRSNFAYWLSSNQKWSLVFWYNLCRQTCFAPKLFPNTCNDSFNLRISIGEIIFLNVFVCVYELKANSSSTFILKNEYNQDFQAFCVCCMIIDVSVARIVLYNIIKQSGSDAYVNESPQMYVHRKMSKQWVNNCKF